MEMAFEIKRGILIQTLCSLLLSILMISHGLESDINCLKSIKDSLEDPSNFLSSSWFFNSQTEGSMCGFTGVECGTSGSKVFSLNLSKMGLKRQFPRGIQNCSSLQILDLSNNELSGPIPSDISSLLPFATNIDLSYNKFTGEIPAAFGDCTYLYTLRLDNNLLRGQMPPELGKLTRIGIFTVSNNHLSGPVPVFNRGSTFIHSYAHKSGLCGGHLAPCSQELDRSTEFHRSFKDGFIVGYVLLVTSVIVAYMSYSKPWTQLKHTKHNSRHRYTERRKTPTEARQIHELLTLQLVEKGNKAISRVLDKLVSTMSFTELCKATDYFNIDNVIGVGKTGMMFKAMLANGSLVAVKRQYDSELFETKFALEMIILGRFSHRNLVGLLGFCTERKQRILVYEFMPNGRLSVWLHPLQNEAFPLEWPIRLKVALGLARALSGLHHSCNWQILHHGISSEYVLLDQNFEPKLSNFRSAKFAKRNNKGLLNKKDVYDFGIVLLELITGKKSTQMNSFSCVIDQSLLGKGFDEEISCLVKVAIDCIQMSPHRRPSMLDVYKNIKRIWEGYESGD